MDLDEAIAHLSELLDGDKQWGCDECKREHEQLREWLIELRNRRSNDG